MKKFTYLLPLFALITAGMFFSSCKEDNPPVETRTITVAPSTSYEFKYDETTAKTFTVALSDNGTDWTVDKDGSVWFEVAKNAVGTGFTVTPNAENELTEPLTGKVTVKAAGAQEVDVTLSMAGYKPTITAAPNPVTISKRGGDATITVTTNAEDWDVKSKDSWLTAVKTNATTVTVSASANGATERSTTVTIFAEGADDAEVTVTQLPDDGTLSIEDIEGTYTGTGKDWVAGDGLPTSWNSKFHFTTDDDNYMIFITESVFGDNLPAVLRPYSNSGNTIDEFRWDGTEIIGTATISGAETYIRMTLWLVQDLNGSQGTVFRGGYTPPVTVDNDGTYFTVTSGGIFTNPDGEEDLEQHKGSHIIYVAEAYHADGTPANGRVSSYVYDLKHVQTSPSVSSMSYNVQIPNAKLYRNTTSSGKYEKANLSDLKVIPMSDVTIF